MKPSAFVWALCAFVLALSAPLLVWMANLLGARELWREFARGRKLVSCRLDSNCPPGHICYEGRCVSEACSTSMDCPPGYVCLDGVCVQAA